MLFHIQTPALGFQAAAQRRLEFMLGSFADPLYKGQWPDSVLARVPSLPTITDDQVWALRNKPNLA